MKIHTHADWNKIPWKTAKCASKDCWCLMVVPAGRRKYKWPNGEEATYVIGDGAIPKEVAARIVALHNADLENAKGQV